jgi:glutamate dehydrogenase (NAD(P)+)
MQVNDLLPREIAEHEEESDPLLAATIDFEEAARHLDLEDWIVARLRRSEREVTLNLPLLRDCGDPVTVGAIRVQHYSGNQPSLGPVQWSRTAHPQRLRAEAMDQSWQSALLQLPVGGAAGAIWFDPAELSERELRELARAYAHGMRGVSGALSDVLAPGTGCNEQTMAWMLDSQARPEPSWRAAAVGKPEALWGIPGYYAATAQGIGSLLRQIRPDPAGQRIAIQGFGNVGGTLASLLHRGGARLVALADISGGLCDPNGLDADGLKQHVSAQGMLFGYPEAEAVRNTEALEIECDVLVLAAAERQITVSNAGRIRSPLVIEAARYAITRAAEQALIARGVTVIPCTIATAGAAIAAASEWAWNVQSKLATPPLLTEVIASHVHRMWEAITSAAQEHNLSLRRTALLLAVRRIAAQMRLMRS